MSYRPSTSFVDNSNKRAQAIKKQNEGVKQAILSEGKVECDCGRNYYNPKQFSQCWQCAMGR